LGRCRGGFSSKLHLACIDESTPVAALLTAGQEAEATAFDPLWDEVRARVEAVDEAVADKAYDSDAIRGRLIDDDVLPVIPNRSNRVDPWPFVEESYRERNCIERLVGKLKQFRRIATRYEKLGVTFMAFVHLVSAFIIAR
jgi:transposase